MHAFKKREKVVNLFLFLFLQYFVFKLYKIDIKLIFFQFFSFLFYFEAVTRIIKKLSKK